MPSNNNNNISKDDQDWLDTLAGKTVADTYLRSEPNEAQLLREALLRRYYEQTLKPQPMQEDHPLLKRLKELGHIKPEQNQQPKKEQHSTVAKSTSLLQHLKSLWEVFFTIPAVPIATACLVMMLHLPLYVDYWQTNSNSMAGDQISSEPILVAKSGDIHYYNDTQSDANPLQTAADFAKKLNDIDIAATLKPTSDGWLLHFQVESEPSKERFEQFKRLLEEKKQTLPVMHYPFDVDILFLPLVEGKPIKTYSLLHPATQTLSMEEKAQQLRTQFEAVGVKTTVRKYTNSNNKQGNTINGVNVEGEGAEQVIDIDLQFPEVLSDAVLEIMDKYGLEPLLLKPTFRQLRISIRRE